MEAHEVLEVLEALRQREGEGQVCAKLQSLQRHGGGRSGCLTDAGAMRGYVEDAEVREEPGPLPPAARTGQVPEDMRRVHAVRCGRAVVPTGRPPELLRALRAPLRQREGEGELWHDMLREQTAAECPLRLRCHKGADRCYQ